MDSLSDEIDDLEYYDEINKKIKTRFVFKWPRPDPIDYDPEPPKKKQKTESYALEEYIKYHQELVPNSPEWKIARKNFDVTASEAASAIGVSDYKTPYKLWKQKKRIEPEDDLDNNPNVKWGIQNEPEARFEFELGILSEEYPDYYLTQPGITVYRKDPRFAASLDNLAIKKDDSDRFIIEYKCPQKLYGKEIPLEYMIQIQCQMEFANCDKCYLHVWRPDASEYTVVHRNKEFFSNFVYPRLALFSTYLKGMDYPQKRRSKGEKEALRVEAKSYFPDIYELFTDG